MSVPLADENATRAAGAALAETVRAGDVIFLSGDLGAGKSTLARGLIGALGFAGEVPSPSFALVIPYDVPDVRLPVAHVDLYRIDDPDEVAALALDDFLHDGALLVEWPERLPPRLWPEALRLHLGTHGGGRLLTVAAPPSWEARCPFR